MKRILPLLTLAVLVLVCPRPAHGQAAVEAWVRGYNGPGNGDDHTTAVAVDTNGNVFVTGRSLGSGSDFDYATIKYSGAGVPLWTNRYNGPGNALDNAYALAVDGSGNVFVTGESEGGSSSSDFATIKYSGAGVPLWTNRYNAANGIDGGFAVALDTNGNVFVTGRSVNSGSDYDYATIKYSNAGVPLWTNRYNGPGISTDMAIALAVDTTGNVLVTGLSAGSGGGSVCATIKYSGAGVPLWTNRYNGPNNVTHGRAVAVDTNGNAFVTGLSYSNGLDSEYVTIKYSGAGVPLWTNRYNGPGNAGDFASAMAVDTGGNVFVTGGSSYDFATIKYSGAGVPLWTNRYNGPANDFDEAYAMAMDTSGNVFVTGYSITSSNFYDYATIAYSGAGVPLWTNRSDGPRGNAFLSSVAVAVDRRGNVFITGYSTNSGNGYDYATIKYSPIPPSLTVALTTTNTVAVSWPSAATGFVLQQNTNGVSSVNWSNVTAGIQTFGTNKTLIVNPTGGNRFYRLVGN